MTCRWKVLDAVGFSPPPFFDPPEVEAAMMRGNAEVAPHRGWGHPEIFRPFACGPPWTLSLREITPDIGAECRWE
jgi:hypothetical protein